MPSPLPSPTKRPDLTVRQALVLGCVGGAAVTLFLCKLTVPAPRHTLLVYGTDGDTLRFEGVRIHTTDPAFLTIETDSTTWYYRVSDLRGWAVQP